jgi:hypothetical protein
MRGGAMTFRKSLEAVTIIAVVMVAVPLFCGFIVSSRRDYSRFTCSNNLKQIALGIHNYAGVHGRLPRTTASGIREHKEGSWLYELIPHMDAEWGKKFVLDPAKPLDAEDNRRVIDQAVVIFTCPRIEDPALTKNFTHYVGVTGIGRDAALLPLADPRCGVFGFQRVTKFKDIKDGNSHTLAVLETTTDNGPWAIGGHGTARGLDLEGTDYLGADGQFNSLHGPTNLFTRPTVTLGLLADGSVRGLTADLSPAVFEALATIAGGEQLPPD